MTYDDWKLESPEDEAERRERAARLAAWREEKAEHDAERKWEERRGQ
jgi:hypothetical protein